MKRNISLLCLLAIIVLGPVLASAQITINIPKIPGITTAKTTQTGRSPGDADLRQAFYKEVGYTIVNDVAVFVNFHDPEIGGSGGPSSEADWAALMARLATLDNLCRTKYQKVTNDPAYPAYDVHGKPALWCAVAAKRVEYEAKARVAANDKRADSFVTIWRNDLVNDLNEAKKSISDTVQRMLFDPTWKTEKFAEVQKIYARENLGQPSMKMFDALEPDMAKVRARIDRESKTNVWEQPPHSDPATETFLKTRFLAYPDYRGTQFLKIGSNYHDWRIFKNSIGIPTNRYKRGDFLVKRPGQNGLCQIREWIVKQEYIGGGKFGPSKIDSFGYGGIYAKCQ